MVCLEGAVVANTITRDQLDALRYAVDRKEYHDLLEKYTGITAVSHIAYSYYDQAGNYLGDGESDVMDLLNAAYIKVDG